MYLAAGLALGSGLLSLFSENAQEAKVKQQLERAKGLARQGLISKEELANRLSSIDKLFNQRLNLSLRSTQLGGRRYANANVVGAGVAGRIGAQAEASKVQYTAGVDRSNAAIYQNLSQLEAGAPISDPIGAFAEGAAAGGELGMEFNKMLNRPDYSLNRDDRASTGGGTSLPEFNYGGDNPFAQTTRLGGQVPTGSPFGGNLNLAPIEDEDIYGFGKSRF